MFTSLSAPQENRTDPEIFELNTRIAQIDAEIETATAKAMEASGALIKYLSDKVTKLDEERSTCVSRLNELQAAAAANQCDVAEITNFISKWDDLTLQDKILVVDALIDKIMLSETEMTIKWKI